MSIGEHIERKLHLLDGVKVNADAASRSGAKIDRLNRNIQKCSCEVNGQDWDGQKQQFDNPFPQKKVLHQANGSAQLENEPLIWKTFDNSLQLEVIL